jgi:RNA polymerase sigma-70 factor, ECF subfamily
MPSPTLTPPTPPASPTTPGREAPPNGPQPADGTLLKQARAGDSAAFATLYDRHAAAAYGLARRMLHNPTAAQDVVQEAFLSLWRTDGYRPEKGSMRNFLLAIVRNRALDALRKDRHRSAKECSDDTIASRLAAVDRTEDEVERRETLRLLRAALITLPDAQHRALDLAFFGGLSSNEIALRLDEPLGTIKGRIRLGLKRLRANGELTGCRDDPEGALTPSL